MKMRSQMKVRNTFHREGMESLSFRKSLRGSAVKKVWARPQTDEVQ